jgi:hypothetical protein
MRRHVRVVATATGGFRIIAEWLSAGAHAT